MSALKPLLGVRLLPATSSHLPTRLSVACRRSRIRYVWLLWAFVASYETQVSIKAFSERALAKHVRDGIEPLRLSAWRMLHVLVATYSAIILYSRAV
jgi:hypothetical protein